MVNIIDDLSELNIPVYVEGDAPEILPEEYFTISEDSTSDNVCADNEPKSILYEFTIKWYTTNPNNLYNGLIQAMTLLRKKRYITTGVGYSNRTYQDKWFSRQADIKKIESLQEV